MNQSLPNVFIENEAKASLTNILNAIPDVSPDAVKAVVDLFTAVNYGKNEIVIDEGEIAEHFYFIYKGLIRVYFHKNDNVVIERFEKEGGFFGGNFSHLTKRPGTHIYDTLEDCILLKIKISDLDALCKANHDVEHIYRVTMEMFHYAYADRIFLFKSLSSEERYNEFMLQFGDYAGRISLKNIANYLGMTSETLSRIRAKYDKR